MMARSVAVVLWQPLWENPWRVAIGRREQQNAGDAEWRVVEGERLRSVLPTLGLVAE